MNSLENLKVGDNVCIRSHRGFTKATVTKITKTQIHTLTNRWRKSDGHRVGDNGWRVSFISEWNDSLEEKYQTKKRVQSVTVILDKLRCRLRNGELDNATLDEIIDLAAKYDIE